MLLANESLWSLLFMATLDSENRVHHNHKHFESDTDFAYIYSSKTLLSSLFYLQVVKIRLQQQKGLSPELFKYKGPIHCARTIVREESILGLWSGAAPTVMRNGTNQAVMFTAKNAFDILLWNKHEGDGKILQPWQSMISGFLAGTAGPFCTGPFDVVKTRLMAQSRDSEGGIRYKGMVHAIRTIYAEEGLVALWRGLLPRLMRIPPGQAIMWAVADQVTGLYEMRYLRNAPL